jgi:hypothetical protein
MLLTVLKIVAGVVVAGVIAMLMLAIVSGLASSARALRRSRKADDDDRA